jgi:predicted ArsR family transcriptional regulator
MQRLISQIGRSQRLAIVNLLKRSQGLTVRELAHRLGMSYMGVKQHCLNLERDGYLGTFRRHRGVGRPELLYHLTVKAQDLFPQADNVLSISLLQQARKLYGASAAEKILFLHFQEKAKAYAEKVQGNTPAERAKNLARLRDREGHMADFENEPMPRIIERHHPMQALFEVFPQAAAMERDLFQRLLGVNIRREQRQAGGTYEYVFFLALPGVSNSSGNAGSV